MLIAHLLFHKNGNKTSIQPIIKLNSTSFMFYKKNSEMKGNKKFYPLGGPRGMGEPSKLLLGSVI